MKPRTIQVYNIETRVYEKREIKPSQEITYQGITLLIHHPTTGDKNLWVVSEKSTGLLIEKSPLLTTRKKALQVAKRKINSYTIKKTKQLIKERLIKYGELNKET